MKNILTRRYYLSDFMYDNYKDDPTNIYDGFFVDLVPDTKRDRCTEFWLGHDDCAQKDFMFGMPNEDWDDETVVRDIIIDNIPKYLESYVNDYFDDVECDCDECCNDEASEIDGSLLEAIEMHNEHVDKMQDLAQVLMDNILDVESTPIDKVFGEAFNSLIGNAIYLCCEANSYGGGWCTTGDWHVMKDEDVEE